MEFWRHAEPVMAKIPRAFLGLLITMATCTSLSASAQRTLVEFWHTGDDGLSQKLADEVERAFERSPDFILSTGRKPGALIVAIPTNVDWKKIRERTQVLYQVEFGFADNKN